MKYDVYGLGNALVDVQVPVDFSVVESTGNLPGSMDLVDDVGLDHVLARLDRDKMMLSAGGSVANTMVGVTALGGTACFTGCISYDEYGQSYAKSLTDAKVDFRAQYGECKTGTCIVLITPDAQRTFLTHLGCAVNLSRDGVDEAAIRDSRYVYIEGYLWDGERSRKACCHAIKYAKEHGVKVAFTASDTGCVERHHGDFREILQSYASLFFANATEAESIADVKGGEAAARELARYCGMAAVTDGANGAFIATRDDFVHVPAVPVTPVDTTGAGDAFAAGFLYGINHGESLEEAGRHGVELASKVISQYGARLAAK